MLFHGCVSNKWTRKGKSSVVRCRNNVRGNKCRVKTRRKNSQKAPSNTPTISTIQSTVPSNIKLTIDDNKRNFLRQFLKKSFFMTDLQAKSYRTDEYLTKLFFETARFSAFNHQWIVKAIINNSQRDVHQCNDRVITYQVIFFFINLILYFKILKSLSFHVFSFSLRLR